MSIKTHSACYMGAWVAELGSLSSGAKMAMKIFVKRVVLFFFVGGYILVAC